MLFDIHYYGLTQALLLLVVISATLLLAFRQRYWSIIDPLALRLFWIGSLLTFIILYQIKHGVDLWSIYFLVCTLFVIVVLYIKLPCLTLRNKNSDFECPTIYSLRSQYCLLWVVFLGVLGTRWPFFRYVFESDGLSLTKLIQYRYIGLQGGTQVTRILSVGFTSFLLYQIFFMIKFGPKKTAIFCLIVFLLLSTLSGGRSTLLSLLFAYGGFVFYFRNYVYINVALTRCLGVFIIFVGLILAAFVSSHYADGHGVDIVLNRIFASADALDYFLRFNAEEHISSGLQPFFYSFLGVYLQYIIPDFHYTNIGTQLINLALGYKVSFAQGPNYIFLLQAYVFGVIFSPIYLLIISILYVKSRMLCYQKCSKHNMYKYFIFMSTPGILADLETSFFALLSGTAVYWSIMYFFYKFGLRS